MADQRYRWLARILCFSAAFAILSAQSINSSLSLAEEDQVEPTRLPDTPNKSSNAPDSTHPFETPSSSETLELEPTSVVKHSDSTYEDLQSGTDSTVVLPSGEPIGSHSTDGLTPGLTTGVSDQPSPTPSHFVQLTNHTASSTFDTPTSPLPDEGQESHSVNQTQLPPSTADGTITFHDLPSETIISVDTQEITSVVPAGSPGHQASETVVIVSTLSPSATVSPGISSTPLVDATGKGGPDDDSLSSGLSIGGRVAIGIVVTLCLIVLIIVGIVFYKRFTHRSFKAFITSSVRYKTYNNATYKDDEGSLIMPER